MCHPFLLLRCVCWIVFCLAAAMLESAIVVAFQRRTTRRDAGGATVFRADPHPPPSPAEIYPPEVCVERTFPGIHPHPAKEAWLNYVWKQGGGLLGTFVLLQDDERRTTTSNGESVLAESGVVPRQRRIFPVGMQEELLLLPAHGDDSDRSSHNTSTCSLQYRVTDLGLFSTWLVPDSHMATVTFQSVDHSDNIGATSSTRMTWKVDFKARNWRNFWQAFTQFNVETVADNLASYLQPPIKYTRRTKLRLAEKYDRNISNSGTKATKATKEQLFLASEWVDFIWKRGGGLPVPFLTLDEQRRIVIPPFLVERLVSSSSTIEYTVDNPGFLTYPVHTHRGRVSFESGAAVEGKTEAARMWDMVWDVEIRPLRGLAWLVKPFTAAIVSTLCRNFKTHVQEPGAVVSLAPPRGKGQAFAEIAKDSWLGGVLAAHLVDRRSTVQQTMALMQPWTWGRSTATDEPGEMEVWTCNNH